ncbi:hypothetical protein [Rhodococcus sp. HNM0569]|uniref:hypothetical protein n=1 Tax=Rhodococcus sp. HNM0569 TaxID=2716340 RepID=UPI00146CCE50|nr:hypothetical protein [Rhodococcus sp. HNM0569]NLU84404.1 hypothetical protein [Rhodococcus sp. HNM0569]
MKDTTVLTGAFALAALLSAGGFVVGAAGGVFAGPAQHVPVPPLASDGLHTADGFRPTPVAYTVSIPPSPSWQVAAPTTPRSSTTTPDTTGPATTQATPQTVPPAPPRTIEPVADNPGSAPPTHVDVTTVAPAPPSATAATTTPPATTTTPTITIPPITTRAG